MRLTDKEKAAIVHEFAAGKNKTEIAKKFGVSDTAVSKILQKYQSSKSLESLTKFEGSSEKVRKKRKEIRTEIIDSAYEALAEKNYEKLSAETF